MIHTYLKMRDEKWSAGVVDVSLTVSRDIRIDERSLFELEGQPPSHRACGIRKEPELFPLHQYADITLLIETLKLLPLWLGQREYPSAIILYPARFALVQFDLEIG